MNRHSRPNHAHPVVASSSGGWPVIILTALALGTCLPLWGGWWEVYRADTDLDLATARTLAIAAVADDPRSADAVAVARWWAGNLDYLDEPEALLSAPGGDRDPELAFMLARLEAELTQRSPVGTLGTAELAGPFGVFDTLDLERDVVPPDSALPPLGTRFHSDTAPVRLTMRFPVGWVGPTEAIITHGVYLAAWSLDAARPAAGWLVVEVQGGVNLWLDGHQVARLRYCGSQDPTTTWYRLSLQPGQHRLRAEISSQEVPAIRVSLLDDSGSPLAGVTTGRGKGGRARRERPVRAGGGRSTVQRDSEPSSWAGSSIAPATPPARAELVELLQGQEEPEVSHLLLAAALARLRGDPADERQWLEAALRCGPDDPLVALSLAQFFLLQPTGATVEEDLQRCRDHLRGARPVPASLLVEKVLASRQDRIEDARRLLDEIVQQYPDDPRVLEMWIEEAVSRGWAREAEESLQRLRMISPSSRGLSELRLEVLEGLERWDERNRLLLALAESEPASAARVEQLASGCLQQEALDILQRLRAATEMPSLDIGVVRLLNEAGRTEEARQELTLAEERWGNLPAFDQLRLVVAAGQDEQLFDQILEEVLERRPWDMDLRTLKWRRGGKPFFEPFRVDGSEVVARQEQQAASAEVDAVLLLDQAVERIYDDGSSIYYYHGITRALTPAGAEQAANLDHLPDSVVLSLRVIKPNGEVVVPPELQPGVTDAVLNDVEAGDLVEEEYLAALEPTGASRRGHLSPYTYRFADADRAFGLSEYVLLVPQGIELKVDGYFAGLEKKEWAEGGLQVIRWRSRSVPPVPREPFAPPEQELLPWVSYGFGVTWQDVGDAIRDQVLPVLRGSPELSAWSRPLLAGDDVLAAARRLVETLSDEVELGRGSLELGTTAGESFSRRRGNRLAIIASALAEAGWEVDLVLARPLAFAGKHLQVPSPELFYQPLLRASSGVREVWFDADEDRRGVDHISPLLQGSDAFLLPLTRPRTAVTYLEQLPEFANPDLEEQQELQIQIDGAGAAQVTLRVMLHGARAERLMQQIRSIPEDRAAQLFHQIAARIFPGADHVGGSIERQEDGAILRIDLELAAACEVSAAQQTMTCRGLSLDNPLSPSLASLAERRFPLILTLPIQRRSVCHLTLPAGWTMRRRPRLLEARWGSVEETLQVQEHQARYELLLRVPAQQIEPEEYPEFARFCHAVDELLSRPPVLERSGQQ